MADSVMSYAIAAGVFAFLTAVLFSSRAIRRLHSNEVSSGSSGTSHSEAA